MGRVVRLCLHEYKKKPTTADPKDPAKTFEKRPALGGPESVIGFTEP